VERDFMPRYWRYWVLGLTFLLCGACSSHEEDFSRGTTDTPPIVSSAPEAATFLETPEVTTSPTYELRWEGYRGSVSKDGTTYITYPRLSLEDDFPEVGTATFIVAEEQDKTKVVCFLVNGNDILYEFPVSDLSQGHLNPDSKDWSKYEGVFYQDLNGDDKKDIVVITFGAVANWPQATNLVTVFLQTDDGFVTDDAISKASLEEFIEKSGLDGDEHYLTIEDVCRYYEEEIGNGE